jgi:hypothetical membrane protein
MEVNMQRSDTSPASILHRIYPAFGVAGSAAIITGMVVSAASYEGKSGEGYSLLNHFVSELGHVGVAEEAMAFNVGLIVGGLLLIPFLIALALSLNNVWAKLGLVAGLVAAISAALVGVFPMNLAKPHVLSTMTHFFSGLLTVVLYGIAIHRQPYGAEVIDRRVNWVGGIAGTAYAAFLACTSLNGQGADQLTPAVLSGRPDVLLPALLEWLVLISTLTWFPLVALSRRTPAR